MTTDLGGWDEDEADEDPGDFQPDEATDAGEGTENDDSGEAPPSRTTPTSGSL